MLKKLFLSVLAIFGLTFLLSPNSYAASDVTYTLSSNSSPLNFCNNNNPDIANCSDYSYIKFSPSDTSLTNTFYIYTQPVPSNQISYKNSFGVFVFSLDNFEVVYFSQTLTYLGNSTITVTLTDNPFSAGIYPEGSLSITSNGIYDVTNYASVSVDIDSELPPYSQIVVDSFWKYHVAIAGGLASIFAIFIVYRIIRSRLR